jgi:hypothetical protein
MSMNSGPRALIRSIRSRRFCKPCTARRRVSIAKPCMKTVEMLTCLSSSWWEVFKGPPYFILLYRLLNFLADLHGSTARSGGPGGREGREQIKCENQWCNINGTDRTIKSTIGDATFWHMRKRKIACKINDLSSSSCISSRHIRRSPSTCMSISIA